MPSKKIFIACPIGADDSPGRVRSDKLLKYIIHPVIKELVGDPTEDVIIRADKIGEPGRITTQIIRELVESDVVIADLTETNPNVMYEVGIRQAMVKPLVLMMEKGQTLPFDLNDLRTVFYQLELEHVEKAQIELKAHLEKALAGSVESIDMALFASARAQSQPDSNSGPSDLLAVLEMCQTVLKATQETKELVGAVGQIVLQLQGGKEEQDRLRQENVNQQMGMLLMNQFFQNPESAEKLIPALQKMAEFAESQKQQKQGVDASKVGRKRR